MKRILWLVLIVSTPLWGMQVGNFKQTKNLQKRANTYAHEKKFDYAFKCVKRALQITNPNKLNALVDLYLKAGIYAYANQDIPNAKKYFTHLYSSNFTVDSAREFIKYKATYYLSQIALEEDKIVEASKYLSIISHIKLSTKRNKELYIKTMNELAEIYTITNDRATAAHCYENIIQLKNEFPCEATEALINLNTIRMSITAPHA